MHQAVSRDDWVDCAKAIGISLVVYGHVARGLVKAGVMADSPLFRVVDSVIYSFHMPLFFFLSGIFFLRTFEQRGAAGLIGRKIDTIVYPYFVWSLIQGSMEVVLSRYTNSQIGWHDLFGILTVPRAQFWFLYALFLIFIVALVLYRGRGRIMAGVVFGAAALAYLYHGTFPQSLYLDFILYNVVYFAAGVCFSLSRFQRERVSRAEAMVLVGCFGALWLAFYSASGTALEAGTVRALTLALCGICAVVAVSKALVHVQWAAPVRLVGVMSMQIFLMHIIAGSGTRVVLSKVLGVQQAWIHLSLATVVAILAPMLAARLLQRAGVTIFFTPPIRWATFKPPISQ